MEETKVVKLPDEILTKIKELQDKAMALSTRLGDLTLQKFNIDKLTEALLEQHQQNIKDENELVQRIQAEYGIGTLDVRTGELTITKTN